MPNVHTPERLEGESFEDYKIRRAKSHKFIQRQVKPENNADGSDIPFLIPNVKNTKHTRNDSAKRKGAL